MTAAAYRALYRRQLEQTGETVTLRRVNSSGPPTDVPVLARVAGFSPQELVGGVNVGDRKIIILAEDVETSGFPVPIKAGGTDKIMVRGKSLTILDVDDSTRRIAGTLVAYEIRASGA
jgi:hypothetical protein